MSTEVVYVCSADRSAQLVASLASLFASDTSFDRVRIYKVGAGRLDMALANPRVIVESVPSLSKTYFLINKTHIVNSPADRVIFLDTDTLVLSALDRIWASRSADVIARPATGGPNMDTRQAAAWTEACRKIAGRPLAYFNAGFVIFQNRSHQRLRDSWANLTRDGRTARSAWSASKIHSARHAEQLGLSLAIGQQQLSHATMDAADHAYGWRHELSDDTAVWHTGNTRFLRCLRRAIREGRLAETAHEPFDGRKLLLPPPRLRIPGRGLIGKWRS